MYFQRDDVYCVPVPTKQPHFQTFQARFSNQLNACKAKTPNHEQAVQEHPTDRSGKLSVQKAFNPL